MSEIPWEGWYTINILVMAVGTLCMTRFAPDMVLVAALSLLIVPGVVSPETALMGFANPALATIAVLYIVAAGLTETGAVTDFSHRVWRKTKSVVLAQTQIMLPVAALSAFLNNTPVVAMLVPTIQQWAKHNNLSSSKLLIPLSYAAILGGSCTVIGTSTNLILYGMAKHLPDVQVGFFEIGLVAVPVALTCIVSTIFLSRRLIKNRLSVSQQMADPKQYAVEVHVGINSPIIGKSIEQAGLRHLKGLYLAEIERRESLLPAVAPTEIIQADDKLLFIGEVDSVAELFKTKGLEPLRDQTLKLSSPRSQRCLIEAVVSEKNGMVGQTIRETGFRTNHDAVILAVSRNGERLPGKVGDIRIRPGDTLLIEAHSSFVKSNKNSKSYLLISQVENSSPPDHAKSGRALAIMAVMVVLVACGLPILSVALIASAALLASRCIDGRVARASIDWSILVVIGASLGIGNAMQVTGAAEGIAQSWINMAGDNPLSLLVSVYVITVIFTAFISNTAAAVLMFPIVYSITQTMGIRFEPFIFGLMMGASASFATPLGYQTNLMVYGPGGYQFKDFLMIGGPITLIHGLVTLLLIPMIWSF